MGAAVHTTCAGGEDYSTLETSFNLVRAITPDTGEIVAAGRVLYRGGRVATAEDAVRRVSDDKLVAHGTSTCLIIATG
jgi:acyl-coenzyme A thioesterase PaaI-like protein